MQYREFGKTGERISALGFGCMRFPEYEKEGTWFVEQDKVNEMLMEAYEKGVNYFDTAPFYCNGNSEKAVGTALKSVRDKVLISTKLPVGDYNENIFEKFLSQSLERLQTDYIDFYHFWGISRKVFDEKIVPLGYLEDARKAREEGRIRHISFSFHDEPESIQYIIDESKKRGVPMESMLIQYNLLDRKNEEMMTYAAQQGLGVVAMGPVGGGRLAAPTELTQKLTGKESLATYELAFKFCLGNPDLDCALSGMENIEMLEQNVQIASEDNAMTEAEWKQIGDAVEQLRKFSELYCTGCAYCQPCPAKIDIPKIFSIYTHKNVYGLHEYAKKEFENYAVKEEGKLLKDCKDCGFCEKKCPQHLKIREQLKRVEAILAG